MSVIVLSKKYLSIFGTPAIDRIDDNIFKISYFSQCLENQTCHDKCCSYGVDIDLDNVTRIMKVSGELFDHCKIPPSLWFINTTNKDSDFPGGTYTRTALKDDKHCIFLDTKNRGCFIHSFCLKNDIDYHALKPMVSSLFPLTFDNGILHASTEAVTGELICLNNKEKSSLYRGIRNEIAHYWGDDLVDELDKLESNRRTE